MQLTYHISLLDNKLEKYLEIAIFRICQELTNNVIKHAEATKSAIYLTQTKKAITIKITDNGKGFDWENVTGMKGMGLKSIKDRVKLLNGTMQIQSQPDKGTQVTIKLPFIG